MDGKGQAVLKQGQVISEINSCEDALGRLSSAISALEEKTALIMMTDSQPDKTKEEVKPENEYCAIAHRIRLTRYSINNEAVRIEKMIKRIEL